MDISIYLSMISENMCQNAVWSLYTETDTLHFQFAVRGTPVSRDVTYYASIFSSLEGSQF